MSYYGSNSAAEEKGVCMATVEDALEKETLTQIENLMIMEDGSEEKRRATEQVKNLVESQVTLKSQKDEKNHRILDSVIKGVSVGGTLILGCVATLMTFKFEETGSINGFASRKTIQDVMNRPKF